MTSREGWVSSVDVDVEQAFADVARVRERAAGLLQRHPSGVPDDALLVEEAVALGVMALDRARRSAMDADLVLAWARYADAAAGRLHGLDSDRAITTAHILAQLHEQRREFPEALAVRRRIVDLHAGRGLYRSAVRAAVDYLVTVQRAGHCRKAADRLGDMWHEWRQRFPASHPDGLDVVLPLVVILAVCGHTDAALEHLAEAAPCRPDDPTRDLVTVQLRTTTAINRGRAEHRPSCTWPGAGADIDWSAALRRAAPHDPTGHDA